MRGNTEHSLQGDAAMSRAFKCFDLEWVGEVAIARFRRGNLEDSWTNQLGDELLSLIEVDKVRKLVISFNEMECLYSTLLGKLLRVKRSMEAAGGRLKLVDVPPMARDVFAVCKLDMQFEFAPDRQSAIKDW
jgi:anti-anti-sigma factor